MRILHRLLLGYAVLLLLAVAGAVLLTDAWFDRAGGAILGQTLGGTALLAAGIWFAVLLARSVSEPLQKLAGATRAVAAGRFEVRVGRSPLAEANTLAANFNEMVETLEAYRASTVEQLLAEQRRSETVLDSIEEGLVIVDGHARIERLNAIAARQLGVTVDAALGSTLDELVGERRFDLPVLAAIRTQAPPLEPPPDFAIGEGARRRTLSVSMLPFHDLARPGVVLVLRDVTAERQYDRLRDDFVLRASHELRTPVGGLRMALELLAERIAFSAGSREAELVETLRSETLRLSTLTDDLLDVSRIGQSDVPLKLEPLSIAGIIDEVRARFAPLAQAREIRLDAEIDPELPLLSLDPAHFPRVLENLLDNALRHTPPGGRLLLRARPQADTVRVEVEDSGEGLSAYQLARIFEPFVQFGEHRGSSGLGLTLCREIVEAHGGRIEARSRPGEGTCFSLRLPWPGATAPAELRTAG